MGNQPITIVNPHGDFEESIERIVTSLGRSAIRREIFRVIYSGGKKPKTVDQILEKCREMYPRQTIVNHLNYLEQHKLVEKTRLSKKGSGRKINAYTKIDFIKANRDKILRFSDFPAQMKAIPTKRRPQFSQAQPFLLATKTRRSRQKRRSPSQITNSKVRVAFLTTNPDDQSSLRTHVEARDVERVVRKSENRDLFDFRVYPAARFVDLVDSINEFRPNIIHFSGHGIPSALIFDNNLASDNGGFKVDFEKLKR